MQTYNEMLPFFGAAPRQPTSLRWNVALESRRRQGAYKRTFQSSSVTSWNWTKLKIQTKSLQLLIVVGWEYCVRELRQSASIPLEEKSAVVASEFMQSQKMFKEFKTYKAKCSKEKGKCLLYSIHCIVLQVELYSRAFWRQNRADAQVIMLHHSWQMLNI